MMRMENVEFIEVPKAKTKIPYLTARRSSEGAAGTRSRS